MYYVIYAHIHKILELSDVGKTPDSMGKKYAFEAGLMRSDLSKDQYNEMLCMEELIQLQGLFVL